MSEARLPLVKPVKNPGLFAGKPGYRLEEDWNFQVQTPVGIRAYCIPRGYLFDGASVPRLFWGFPFGYTPYGVHIAAALEHDWLCDVKPVPSRVAHEHFERRLREDGVRSTQAAAMGWAVRWFGPRFKGDKF